MSQLGRAVEVVIRVFPGTARERDAEANQCDKVSGRC